MTKCFNYHLINTTCIGIYILYKPENKHKQEKRKKNEKMKEEKKIIIKNI